MKRKFVESSGFTDDRRRLGRERELAHDDLVALEQSILRDPRVGDLVPGTGGLRKVRLAQRDVGRGKRGGVRVYYLDLPRRSITHLVAMFGSERSPTSRPPSGATSQNWSRY